MIQDFERFKSNKQWLKIYKSDDDAIAILKNTEIGHPELINSCLPELMDNVVTYGEYVDIHRENPYIKLVIAKDTGFKVSVLPSCKLYERKLTDNASMTIIVGGFGSVNPKSVLLNIVYNYVGNKPYTAFVPQSISNPWVIVLVFGLNELL